MTLPMPPEELTAGPTIEPAPERVEPEVEERRLVVCQPRVDGEWRHTWFLGCLTEQVTADDIAKHIAEHPQTERTCTRSAPCQVRSDQDEVLATHTGDATCALLRRDENGWGLYVGGDLVTLVEFCPWCGGRLA